MKWLSKTYVGLLTAFLYAPILVLIEFSFNQSKTRGAWTGFSTRWYEKLFTNEIILQSLGITLIVAVISSIFATIIGTMAAIGISKMKRFSRNMMMNVVTLKE